MVTLEFFEKFANEVKKTAHWQTMENTVEDSPWHREENTAVHTEMAIEVYLNQFALWRTEREQMLAMMALLFHDFGKVEAEETKERKDGSGQYRSYAGHEAISANEFLSFMCDNHELRQMFFKQGYGWEEIRTIKFMIEHHLPYGLKNPTKRADLRKAIAFTMKGEEEAFWDMLRSDAKGRISDNHEEKLSNVEEFITTFRHIAIGSKSVKFSKILTILVGISGAGKSTWVNSLRGKDFIIFSEDALREKYAKDHVDELQNNSDRQFSDKERYDLAWKYCHMNSDSLFDKLVSQCWDDALTSGLDIILDRMNHSKKGRSKYINSAKQKGYFVHAVEFFVSEKTAKERQQTRNDKSLPESRVHQIYMQQQVPWLGVEVDSFELIAS